MPTTISARCTCGSCRFTSAIEPELQLTCHCQQCRQVSKKLFSNLAFFKESDSRIEGQTTIHEFTADSGAKTVRETCATCGDMLLDRTEGYPGMVGIVAELIQAPYEFHTQCHVWITSKSDEVIVPEGIKTYAGNTR